MKTKIILFVTLSVLITFISTSCKKKQSNSEPEAIIQFDTIKVSESYHLLNNGEYPESKINIQFIYPKAYKDEVVLATLKKIFVSQCFGAEYAEFTPEATIKGFVDNHFAEYKKLEADLQEDIAKGTLDGASQYTDAVDLKDSIVYFNENLLSFITDIYSYAGGAHGNTSYVGSNIDLKTGKLLVFDDVFKGESKDAIRNLVIDRLIKMQSVNSVKELEDMGYSVENIQPTNNFTIDDKGITFIYGQYEIAPYVFGIAEIFIPYAELESYMKVKY